MPITNYSKMANLRVGLDLSLQDAYMLFVFFAAHRADIIPVRHEVLVESGAPCQCLV